MLGAIERLRRPTGRPAGGVMIGATTGVVSAYLPEDVARAV